MGKENKNDECCIRYKETPRSAELQEDITKRINRITGQLGGIKNMVSENRYCGDILIQIAAVESALQNVGYLILQEHMNTCVAEKIKNGDEGIIEETMDLMKKLK